LASVEEAIREGNKENMFKGNNRMQKRAILQMDKILL